MKTAVKEVNTKYDEKIKKLTAMYADKSLSRKERQEVLQELNRVKYLADPRPSVSVRTQTIISTVFSCLMSGNLIITSFLDQSKPLPNLLNLIFAVGLLIYLCILAKFKKEPDDELSLHSRHKAGRLAAFVFIIIAATVGFICFDALNLSLTLTTKNWLGFFLAGEFAYVAISDIIFLILEGRTPKDEE